MTTSVNEVCDVLQENPKPLVFLDTCTILDVVNALHSGNLSDDYIQQAARLIGLHQDNRIHLVTALNVEEEYTGNIDTVVERAEIQIKLITQQVKKMLAFHNSIMNSSIVPQQPSKWSLHSHARTISEKLLASCDIIERKTEYSARAMDRVRGNLAPARQGGGEAKDCEIIECFLDVSRQLRSRAFQETIVFTTANTKDYGNKARLKAPLDTEFEKVNSKYANHLNHALKFCGF